MLAINLLKIEPMLAINLLKIEPMLATNLLKYEPLLGATVSYILVLWEYLVISILPTTPV